MNTLICCLLVSPTSQTETESYREFADRVIRPTYEQLAEGLQYDRIDVVDDRSALTRWYRVSSKVAVLAYPQENPEGRFTGPPILDEAFLQHRILNNDYVATIKFFKAGGAPTLDSVKPKSDRQLDGVPGYSEYLTRLPLHELAPSPLVTVREFTTASPGMKKLKLTIRRRGNEFDEPATLILDAKLGRCVETRYQTQSGAPWRTTRFSYAPTHGAETIATEIRTQVHALPEFEQPASQEDILIGHVQTRAELSEVRFRLTHYGLPEPDFVKRGGWPMWAWFLVIGGVLIVAGKLVSRSRWSPA